MRLMKRMSLFLLLASPLTFGQSSVPARGSAANPSDVAAKIQALQDAADKQQRQIADQQRQIMELKQQLAEQNAAPAKVLNATLTTSASGATVAQGEQKPKESPLSFHIGGTEFTPGGFVDFGNVFRSTNTGNNISTGFGGIPFSNTVAGHLTEYRATAQYSRISMKVAGKYGANDVTGYIEADFNGNDAANVFTTSNPHTFRMRQYYLDLKRGKWEFLAGQTYGMMTASREGLNNLLITTNVDANIYVGFNYTRANQLRTVYHFNDNLQWGVGIENPEQFATAVTFPSAFNSQLTGQFNPQNGSNGTPNVAPDIVTKMALDGKPGGRPMHFELGGIMTSAKATFLPVGGTTFQHTSTIGGGLQTGFLVSMTKNFRFVGDGLWGDGVGRYMIGLGPQVVVRPIQTGPTTFTAETSGVHAGNGLLGLEMQATPKTVFGAYYGGAYFQRNFALDVTSTAATKPFVGYGGPNSANSNNRAIQEGTFIWDQTFWKSPQYGAVVLVTQYSYLTRAPWFVAAGAPKNAHLGMAFVDIRYVLP